jgi:hypothetical protein
MFFVYIIRKNSSKLSTYMSIKQRQARTFKKKSVAMDVLPGIIATYRVEGDV